MKDRIASLIKSERLTSQQFAELVDMQSSTISHILAGRNSPSFRIIYGILEAFPMVSPDWLILGKGEMYRPTVSPEISPINDDNEVLFPEEINEEQEQEDNSTVQDNSLFTDVNIDSEESTISINTEPTESEPVYKTPIESKNTCQYAVNEVRTDKIIIMYSDNTFDIYNPR